MGVEFHVVQSVIPRSSFLPSVGCWTFRGVLHFARVGTDGLLMRLLVLCVLCEGGRLYYSQLHPLSCHCTSLLGDGRLLAYVLKFCVLNVPLQSVFV